MASELSGSVPNEPAFDGFEGLGGDFDEITLSEVQPPTAAPVAPPAPAAAPPAAPPTAPANAVQQAQATAPASSPVSQPTQAPAASPAEQSPAQTGTAPVGPDDVLNALASDTGQIRDNLIKSFALTSEQAAALESDPIGTLPKIATDIYMRSVTTALQYMKHIVPTMLVQHLTQMETAKQATKEFFEMWPDLNEQKHASDIRTLAQAFVQANPNIDRKTLFSLVGPAVMAKHGIRPGATQAPAQPALNSPPGYRPIASSAPVVVQRQTGNENPFLGLGEDYDGM